MTPIIVKSLITGVILIVAGILVGVFVSSLGWAMVLLGVLIYFYLPLGVIAVNTRQRPSDRRERTPVRYGSTILGTVLRSIDPKSDKRR